MIVFTSIIFPGRASLRDQTAEWYLQRMTENKLISISPRFGCKIQKQSGNRRSTIDDAMRIVVCDLASDLQSSNNKEVKRHAKRRQSTHRTPALS